MTPPVFDWYYILSPSPQHPHSQGVKDNLSFSGIWTENGKGCEECNQAYVLLVCDLLHENDEGESLKVVTLKDFNQNLWEQRRNWFQSSGLFFISTQTPSWGGHAMQTYLHKQTHQHIGSYENLQHPLKIHNIYTFLSHSPSPALSCTLPASHIPRSSASFHFYLP